MPAQSTTSNRKHQPSLTEALSSSEIPRLSTRQIQLLQIFTASRPILVSDDDPMSRLLYRSIFEHAGLTHLETRSSSDALEICRKQPISVVISDILKPHMSGLQMLEDLRQHPRTRYIPLIFVTGMVNTEDIAWQSGADGYLQKPFHPNALLVEIWHLLSNKIK